MLSGSGVAAIELVVVPQLALVSAEQASQELQDLDLKVNRREETNDIIPPGIVIETDPPAGTEVEVGSFVILVVSAGAEQFGVPEVVGETEDVARALIEAQGFQIGQVTYTLTEDIAESTVISQSPAAGTPAEAGTLVDLVVSRGPFSLEVPDVSGMSAEGAQLELARVGFEDVSTEEEFSPDVAPGFVTRTDPESGRVVARETPITIYVSKGQENTTIPELLGLSPDAAQAAATQAKLTYVDGGTVEVTAVSGLVGFVAEQDPVAGETVPVESQVTVKIGVIRQVTVPDFDGMTQLEAEAAAAEAGLIAVFTGEDPTVGEDDDGLVVSQDPIAGSTLDDGSSVGLILGRYIPPPTTATTEAPPTTLEA
jgi:serine/threonine-protein kinase